MKVSSGEIKEILGEIDLFIVSSGFEERSTTLALHLDAKSISSSVIYHLSDNYILAETHRNVIKQHLTHISQIDYPKNDPFETYKIFYTSTINLISDNSSVNRKLSVVVDVTGFSREALLILIKVLSHKDLVHKINIYLVHTPVESYSNDENMWLTKGVREIRPIFGYSGIITPSKKTLLLILGGFEDERTQTIIDTFEPHSLILGRPSLDGSVNIQLKDLAEKKFEKIKSVFNNIIIETIEFSCLEIDSTIDTIDQIYQTYNNKYNIIISPLNNKISTVASAIAAINNENIQISYASANQYNITKKLVPTQYFILNDISKYIKQNH